MLPQDIMMKVSQHYAEHMDACHQAAEEDDLEKLDALTKRHDAFKKNVNKLIEVELTFASDPYNFDKPDANLFSITLLSAVEPVFPDHIGGHTKLLVASWDDVYTALYAREGWEEDHVPDLS